jgi:hypothetical protein
MSIGRFRLISIEKQLRRTTFLSTALLVVVPPFAQQTTVSASVSHPMRRIPTPERRNGANQ